jgi:alanine racemase
VLAQLRIDLGAIRRNTAALATLVAPSRLVPVVKANAYGHGLAAVATALAPRVGRLAVYELDEALVLRDAGITIPIHVLGPIPVSALDAAVAANIDLTLWDDGYYVAEVAQVARRRGTRVRVHAKIDTGVTRLGMRPGDAPRVLSLYGATPELELVAVFSHLAAAEELDSTFTEEQLARFAAATSDCAPSIERHVAASAAAMLWPQTRLDAVRAGIAIYGLWPSPETAAVMRERGGFTLEPALTWTTQLVAVHDVPAHTPVGYGCAYHTKRPSRIGVLPIGYAEGLPRAAGDRGFVLIAGRRARIVGRVCMNMAFVDVTTFADAAPETRVTLIGRDGDETLTADDLASAAGTINYEIVARLPAHVPRTYLDAPTAASAARKSIVPS